MVRNSYAEVLKMHRFFFNKKDIKENKIYITGNEAKHIINVLRLKVNDKIILCDGVGKDYCVMISSIEKESLKVKILSTEASVGEPCIDIVIYQSIPKSTKMDYIIQKCTEIGVKGIVPVYSARTIVKLESEERERKKVERWQKIAYEAAKQSGRGRIPVISMPLKFENALRDSMERDLTLIPYEEEKTVSFKEVLKSKNPKNIGIFIGPEGGFEEDEIESAINSNAKTVTLGSRILRTETAGLVVLSCILYEYNQM